MRKPKFTSILGYTGIFDVAVQQRAGDRCGRDRTTVHSLRPRARGMRHGIAVAFVCSFVLSTPTANALHVAQAEERAIRHVVVITLDNTHWDEIERMPHLEALMRQGTTFDNDHSVLTAYTGPDMVSFLTGTYPDKSGIAHNHFFQQGSVVSYWAYWDSDLYLDRDRRSSVVTATSPYIWVQNPWQQFNDHGWDVGVVRETSMAMEHAPDVRRYGVMNAAVDPRPEDYTIYAIHCANGSMNCTGAGSSPIPNSVFGIPNISWLRDAPLLDGKGTLPLHRHGTPDAMEGLSATYAMQEHGIQVTYTFIPSVHHIFARNSPEYLARLHATDHAFQLFLQRLNDADITPSNTLFVLTSDEGDFYYTHHPRKYDLPHQISRIPACRPGRLHMTDSSAPFLYVSGTQCRSALIRTIRRLGGWRYLADRSAQVAAHMATTADSPHSRWPTFALFGAMNSWWVGTDRIDREEEERFQNPVQWTHGTIDPAINRTWLAIVGPGVARRQVSTFIDHVDAMPTLDYLLGYQVPENLDGRILFEALAPSPARAAATSNRGLLPKLASAFKQLNAPLGSFARRALEASTEDARRARRSSERNHEIRWLRLIQHRNALVRQLRTALNGIVEGKSLTRVRITDQLREANSLLLTIARGH